MAPAAQRPQRFINANAVLTGRWTGDGYPFRYVVLWNQGVFSINNALDGLLSACEILESRGWEMFHIDETNGRATLRRPQLQPPPPSAEESAEKAGPPPAHRFRPPMRGHHASEW